MNVYVVMYNDSDTVGVMGVYTTQELAKAAIAGMKLKSEYSRDYMYVESIVLDGEPYASSEL